MGPIIDKVAAMVAGVEGIQAVHQSSRSPLTDTPAALIEAVCEGQQWEQELGSQALRLELRLSVAIVEALPSDPAQVPAARDRVMALARACRAALAADPSLDGGCLTTRVKRTDFSYSSINGGDYAQALTLLDAVKQQAF
jgi:hypothetical protein